MSIKWWAPIVHFAGHTVGGSIIFIIIAMPAIGLSLLVEFLGENGIPQFTITVLTILEHTILVIDAVLFVIYLVVTAIKAGREWFL